MRGSNINQKKTKYPAQELKKKKRNYNESKSTRKKQTHALHLILVWISWIFDLFVLISTLARCEYKNYRSFVRSFTEIDVQTNEI